jgi:hypothetical protein
MSIDTEVLQPGLWLGVNHLADGSPLAQPAKGQEDRIT